MPPRGAKSRCQLKHFSGAASWASAPCRSTQRRCFLPRTTFLKPCGARISAAELRSSGGDVLMGPHGQQVSVLRSIRHQPPVERDVVCIFTVLQHYPFQVTASHRLLVEGPAGSTQPVSADSLLNRRGPIHIFDGSGFQTVIQVRLARQVTEVVEVTFVEDAAVLAWILPKRATSTRRPQLQNRAAVACLGTRLRVNDFRLDLDDFGLGELRGVLTGREPMRCGRSRSADGRLQFFNNLE